jgi:hypothetical protein
MSMKNIWARFGVNYFGKKLESANRVERDANGAHFLANRSVVRDGAFMYAWNALANIDTMKLRKYDATFNYQHNDVDITLKHFTPSTVGDVPTLGKVQAALTWRASDKINASAQVSKTFTAGSEKTRLLIGATQVCNDDLSVRAKVDSNMKVYAGAKYKLDKNVTFTMSGKVDLSKGANAVNFNKLLPIPLGWTWDIGM